MNMKQAEGSVTLRAPLLLLGLWMVLAPVQRSQGYPSWRYISSEVVIPRKELHTGKGIQTPGWLSYSLGFGGQRHIIHMRRKKLFWPRHLVMMTQDDQGALQVDEPFVPLDCYYLGYLEEVPLSMVTVDTCYGGLKGIMKLDDLTYEIKPLKDSQVFEHVVSQIVTDTNVIGPTYVLGHKEESHPLFPQVNTNAAPRLSVKLYASHYGVSKGCIISSHSVYTTFGNMTKCVQYLVRIGHLIDTLMQGLSISWYVSFLVVYDRRDPTAMDNYAVPGSPFHTHYVANIFNPLTPHSSVLLNNNGPHELNSAPHLNGVCKNLNLVMLGILSRHYYIVSLLATQLIMRSFGMAYDDNTCVCQRRATCIMSRYPVLTDTFSNCSMVQLTNILNYSGRHCIFKFNAHLRLNKSLTYARCGNNELDGGEQCDCGSFKQCYSSPCCKTDCTFTTGSACHTGTCCTNCSYSPPGTLCRPIQNMCDLPEYCLGQTFTCPEDVYLQDGTPCTEDGYCYHGNCTDLTVHCKEIFGEGALKGPDACYSINKKGNRFGQCTNDPQLKYKVCNGDDVKCGRLQCTNVTYLPMLQEHIGFHQSLMGGSLCFGLDLHPGVWAIDIGHVRPGTPCAKGKFCRNSVCNGSMAAINYDCHPYKCNLRGICNNKGNCHCHVGWDPPRCIEIGAGGSTNSGPPPRRTRSVTPTDETMLYLRLIFGRTYAIIAALLFGVASNVRTVKTAGVQEVRR